jgi:hypothetical protein
MAMSLVGDLMIVPVECLCSMEMGLLKNDDTMGRGRREKKHKEAFPRAQME